MSRLTRAVRAVIGASHGAEWQEHRPDGGYTRAGDPRRCSRPSGPYWAIYRHPDGSHVPVELPVFDDLGALARAERETPPTTVLVAVLRSLGPR